MNFRLRIPGRDHIEVAPVANSANPLIAAGAGVVEVVPISGIAGLAAAVICDSDPDRWCWPHSDSMNGTEMARFIGRVKRAVGRGIPEDEAERLADDLVLTDRRPSSSSSSSSALTPPARPSTRSCAACANLTKRRTCTEPVNAGLAELFGIRWPEPGYGASCIAFKGNS
jgi:hypothetical protein